MSMFYGLSNPDGYAFIPEDPPPSLERLTARYAFLERRRSPDDREAWLNWIMVGADGRPRGYLQATVRLAERDASIAYFVFAPWRGQGLAAEGLRELLPALCEAYGLRRVEAQIDTRNLASLRLIEALGFARTAFVAHADDFKGMPSDEYHYALEMREDTDLPYDARRD